MDQSLLTVVVVVGVVAALALLLRRGGDESVRPPMPGATDVLAGDEVAEAGGDPFDEAPDDGEALAVTVDGWTFVPAGPSVHLLPPGDPAELVPERATRATGLEPTADPETQVLGGYGAPVDRATGRRTAGWKPGETLQRGDLVGARVRPAEDGGGAWVLEALGRDHDWRGWTFEDEASARAGLALVEGRVVRAPRDRDGEDAPPGHEDFERARAEHLAIESEAETLADAPPERPQA